MRQSLTRPDRILELALAGLALLCGLGVGFMTLGRGVWLDEFWTLITTPANQSAGAFWEAMGREVHPPLHYGLIKLARAAGLEDLGALRALNILGVALAGAGLWHALKNKAISVAQACALVALYASSPMFLDNFAELRAYFLLFSASVAVSLAAVVLARKGEDGAPWKAGDIAIWTVLLAVFVGLHYFALLFGGVLTLALAASRRGKGVIPFMAASALAATPTLLMLALQTQHFNAAIVQWVATGRIDAALVMLDQGFAAGGYNLIAFGLAAWGLLAAAEAGGFKALRAELVLIGALIAFCGVLVVVNAIRPVVIDRYLIAAGGGVVVTLALFAGAPSAPKWAVATVCVFALVAQARFAYSGIAQKPGWSQSANVVAGIVKDCPSARVFIDPIGDETNMTMYIEARRFGLSYYAQHIGVAASEIAPGGVLPAPGECPNVIWLEHIRAGDAESPLDFMRKLQIQYEGAPYLLRAGTGTIVVIR